MCEIILEVFKFSLSNNTQEIINLSSKMMKDLKGKKEDGMIVYDLREIKNIGDIKGFVKLLMERNILVEMLKKDLDKEYMRNKDYIKQLNKIHKSKL